MASDTDRAWAAGFFDGEGCVRANQDRRHGGRVGLEMQVVQTGPEDSPPLALLRFRDAIGGHGQIYRRKDNTGRLGTKPLWSWRCGSTENVLEIATLLLPFLTVKIDQLAGAVARRTEYLELLKERERFCKRGHDLMETAYPNNLKRKNCRECNRIRMAEWRLAQKGG